MTDNCKSCSWLCPVEQECLLGYFDCLKELKEEYEEEIKEASNDEPQRKN